MRLPTMLLLTALCLTGCNRAVYINVQGDKASGKMTPEQFAMLIDFDETNWQHYFFYGLVPSETVIDAAGECGGKEHVAGIKTQQTFMEGLMAILAGYYVNIYSPYDGHVVCDNGARTGNFTPSATPPPR